MAVDISIAVFLCLVSFAMAYMGVHVTLHPTEDPRIKWRYKVGFWLCAVVAIILIAVQTARNARTQATTQAQLADLQRKLEHTHIRMEITSLAVTDGSNARRPANLADTFASEGRAMFNVSYWNVGASNTERTGAGGEVLLLTGRPQLDAAFSRVESAFKKSWTGSELVPQQYMWFTVSSRALSKTDIEKIGKGKLVVFVIAMVKFSDSTGDYQQDMCQWLQPPGTSPVWHGCGVHESEKKRSTKD